MKKYLCYCLSIVMLISGLSFAMGKKPKQEPTLHEEILSSYATIQEHMDAIFEEHRKQMEAMHKRMNTMVSTGHTVSSSMKMKGCKYSLNINDIKKQTVQVALDDRILSISGMKGDKDMESRFMYSVTVPKRCIGNPDVKYHKDGVDITFDEKED